MTKFTTLRIGQHFTFDGTQRVAQKVSPLCYRWAAGTSTGRRNNWKACLKSRQVAAGANVTAGALRPVRRRKR